VRGLGAGDLRGGGLHHQRREREVAHAAGHGLEHVTAGYGVAVVVTHEAPQNIFDLRFAICDLSGPVFRSRKIADRKSQIANLIHCRYLNSAEAKIAWQNADHADTLAAPGLALP